MPWREPEYEGEFPTLGWEILGYWHDILPSPRDEKKPFTLTDRQALSILEWYAIHPVTGQFIYRRGCSQEAKKTGKSPLEAAKCITELSLPCRFDGWGANGDPVARPWGHGGDPDPWVQIASLSEDQDDNTWTPLYTFLTANDGKAADELNIDAGLTRCFLRGRPAAKIEPVTSRAGSREGQPVTYGSLDETGLMTPTNGGKKLAATIRRNVTGMGGRVYETTNGYPPGEQTVAEATHKAAAARGDILYICHQAPRELDGVRVDLDAPDEVLVAALQVPYKDCWWNDPERIVADIRDPDMAWGDSVRFFFNWNESPETSFIDGARWDTLATERIVEPGDYIALGFDGSITRDHTSLYGCTRDGFLFEIRNWARPDNLPRDAQWRIPRGEVHEAVQDAFDTYNVGRMFCDPAKWETEIEGWVNHYGDDSEGNSRVMVLDTNQKARFAPACRRFDTAVNEQTISHDGKDTLTAHLAACARKKVRVNDDDEDGRTMFVIVKADTRKIDAAVAAVLAHEAAMTMPDPAPVRTWFGSYG